MEMLFHKLSRPNRHIVNDKCWKRIVYKEEIMVLPNEQIIFIPIEFTFAVETHPLFHYIKLIVQKKILLDDIMLPPDNIDEEIFILDFHHILYDGDGEIKEVTRSIGYYYNRYFLNDITFVSQPFENNIELEQLKVTLRLKIDELVVEKQEPTELTLISEPVHTHIQTTYKNVDKDFIIHPFFKVLLDKFRTSMNFNQMCQFIHSNK